MKRLVHSSRHPIAILKVIQREDSIRSVDLSMICMVWQAVPYIKCMKFDPVVNQERIEDLGRKLEAHTTEEVKVVEQRPKVTVIH